MSEGFQDEDLGEIQELMTPHRRNEQEMSASHPVPDVEGEDRRSGAGKQIDIRQLGRRVLIIQDCF